MGGQVCGPAAELGGRTGMQAHRPQSSDIEIKGLEFRGQRGMRGKRPKDVGGPLLEAAATARAGCRRVDGGQR